MPEHVLTPAPARPHAVTPAAARAVGGHPLPRLVALVAATLLAFMALVLVPAPGAEAASSTTLAGGQQLRAGQSLNAGNYRLAMQSDGNLVVYGPENAPRWHTWTYMHPGSRLVMQTDGNLVLYSSNDVALWNSRTWGNPGARAVIQGDGNLVVYRADNVPLWHIGPAGTGNGLYAIRSGLAVGACGNPDDLARKMAASRSIYHGGSGWNGQIVGMASDPAGIVQAWRGSAPHSRIAADGAWRKMQAGSARGSDGYLYGVVNFCR